MQQAYLNINEVRTKISTWGRWVEESKSDDDSDEVVIIIPGNPGVNGFYDTFCQEIHEKLECPVWCVGHAGHNIPENNSVIKIDHQASSSKDKRDLYNLKGQIDHKIDFFEKYVPPTAKVHLIGHSVGSYIILEMLNHPSVKNKVADVHLLFPAIETMAETKNGQFMLNYVKYIYTFLVLLSNIFLILPNFVQTLLLYIYMIVTRMPISQHLDSIKGFIHPKILHRVFNLAYEEFEVIKKRNDDVIRNNLGKIRFLYGVSDGWAPASYCDRLKVDIPNVRAELTTINHAFVLKNSVEVANIVSEWIKSDR